MADESKQQRQTAYKVLAKDLVNGTYNEQEGFNPNFVRTPSGRTVSRVRVTGTVTNTFTNDDESYAAITVDDGTATIRGKAFQELDPVQNVDEGQIVELVGKVREYEGEIYIQAEHVFTRALPHELVHVLDVHNVEQDWRELVNQVREHQDKNPGELANQLNVDEDTIQDMQEYIDEVGFDTADNTDTEGENTAATTQGGPQQPSTAKDAAEDGEDETGEYKDTVLQLIKQTDTGDGADYTTLLDETSLEEETFETVVNDLLSDGTCYEPRPGKIKIL